MKKILQFSALILLISSQFSFAQLGSHNLFDTRSMGLGNTGTANTDDFQGFVRNPALLFAAGDSSKMSFSLMNFGVQAYTNTITLDEFNYYFNHTSNERLKMSQIDKDKLISNFNGNGNVIENLQINYLTLNLLISPKIGGIGISVYDQLSTKVSLPKELVELLFNGNSLDRVYGFNELAMQNWITRTYQFSYSHAIIEDAPGIKAIKGGISAKVISGYGYSQLETVNSYIKTNQDYNITGSYLVTAKGSYIDEFGNINPFGSSNKKDFSPMPSAKSSGLGIDIGFLAEFESGLKIGLSLNEIGSITWKDNPNQYTYSHSFVVNDITNQKQIDSLTNGGKEQKVIISQFNTPLPTNLRVGLMMPLDSLVDALKGLTVHLDLTQGFNQYFLNNLVTRYSMGLDWKVSKGFRMAAGVSNDYSNDIHVSFGLGFRAWFFEFNLATLDVISLIKASNHASIGMNLCFYLW